MPFENRAQQCAGSTSAGSFSGPDCAGSSCYSGAVSTGESLEMPMLFIAVEFHFIKDSNGFNFECAPGPDNALDVANQILDRANQFFAAPTQSQVNSNPSYSPPTVPDTRIRYQLANGCGSIFFHDSEPLSFPQTGGMKIVVMDQESQNNNGYPYGGQQVGGDIVKLFNIHYAHFHDGIPINDFAWKFGTILNHEFGHLTGESSYKIGRNNTFRNKVRAVALSATGDDFNNVECNFIEGQGISGVWVNHRNANLEILGNEFLNDISQEIEITGTVSSKGQIQATQGSSVISAGNCFASPVKAIRAFVGSTEPFDYYVFNLENAQPCFKPTNNLSDGGTNNYYNRHASIPHPCTGGVPPNDPPTEGDLVNIRQNAALTLALLQADPTNLALRSAYDDVAGQQNAILRSLVSAAIEGGNLNLAENLLLGENTNAAIRQVVGIRTKRGNISGAQELLNAMPVENQDDDWFKTIMAINFDIEQSPTNACSLTPQQELTLQAIASTESSIMRGYACALLSFCNGTYCEDAPLPLEGEGPGLGEGERVSPKQPKPSSVSVAPIPANDLLRVVVPGNLDENLSVELYDFSGKLVSSVAFVNLGQLDMKVSELSNGVYWLKINAPSGNLFSGKTIIIH